MNSDIEMLSKPWHLHVLKVLNVLIGKCAAQVHPRTLYLSAYEKNRTITAEDFVAQTQLKATGDQVCCDA